VHAQAEAVEEYLAQHNSPAKVRLVREEKLLGSAGTLAANREWVESEAAFWILYADVLTSANLRRMADFHQARAAVATLGLYQVAEPSRCGIAITDEKQVIIEFEEKPKHPRSDWAFTGLMVASPKLLDHVPACVPADIGFHVLPRLIGEMLAYPIADYLLDIGTPQNYQTAQLTWPGLDRAPALQEQAAEAASRLRTSAKPRANRVASGEAS